MTPITVFQFLIEVEKALQAVGTDALHEGEEPAQIQRIINYQEERARIHLLSPSTKGRASAPFAIIKLKVVPHKAVTLAISAQLSLPAQGWREETLLLIHERENMKGRAFSLANALHGAYEAPVASPSAPAAATTQLPVEDHLAAAG